MLLTYETGVPLRPIRPDTLRVRSGRDKGQPRRRAIRGQNGRCREHDSDPRSRRWSCFQAGHAFLRTPPARAPGVPQAMAPRGRPRALKDGPHAGRRLLHRNRLGFPSWQCAIRAVWRNADDHETPMSHRCHRARQNTPIYNGRPWTQGRPPTWGNTTAGFLGGSASKSGSALVIRSSYEPHGNTENSTDNEPQNQIPGRDLPRRGPESGLLQTREPQQSHSIGLPCLCPVPPKLPLDLLHQGRQAPVHVTAC
jgi:hypothetical protein